MKRGERAVHGRLVDVSIVLAQLVSDLQKSADYIKAMGPRERAGDLPDTLGPKAREKILESVSREASRWLADAAMVCSAQADALGPGCPTTSQQGGLNREE